MKLVKRVLVMHNGELIAEGTPEEIAKNKKVIEVYLGKAV
jgi:ABC-type branched-subunit amino acid transport system ATPase component